MHKNTYLPYTWLKRRAIMGGCIARLDKESQKVLDDFLQTKTNLSLANERAAFQSGIQVALELFR